ncbi:MAG: TonB-dependent receptor plug domain-containing protein [Steroidobacteraceae bacterium]
MKPHLLTPAGPLVVLLAASMTAAPPAVADTDTMTVDRLRSLSVEQLMNIEVTSVARYPEKLLHAASAIQVITQEDIRRSGATSIAEVLRLADNLEVAQKNSHDWAISARGFNTALANKLLVMIDGRTVYTPLFSGVFWDVQDYLLQDIDRIEVISGPGGTLWGANAVNGVINIITKSAKDTQGTYVETGGGTQLDALVGARYGGTISPDTWFRIYTKYVDRADEVMTDGAPGSDAWHQGRAGFRIDSDPSSRDALTVQGDVYDGYEYEPTGGQATTSGGNLLGRWSSRFSDDSDMSLQSYIDYTHLLDPEPALTLGTLQLAAPGTLQDDLTTYDMDFQDRIAAGAYHRIVWGLGFRRTHDAVVDAPGVAFLPNVLNQNLYSTFLQDEIALESNLSFILGTKLEHNDYTGWELQPNARLQWSFAPEESLWGAVSRAVRTPSRLDRDLYEAAPPGPLLLRGSSDFVSEKLIAYELGYRGQIGPRFGSSVSTYYNVYSDLRSTSYTPGTVLPFYFANNLEGDTYGLEFSSDYQVSRNWSLHAGYTLLKEHLRVKPGQADINDARNETADPQHQFSVRSSANLPWRLKFDSELRWVDTLHTNSGPTPGTVPAYFELNSRIAWQASPTIELSIVGENLLHPSHPEYGFPEPTRIEIDRSIYARLAWRR